MDARTEISGIDPLLLPFLRAGDEAEAQRLLAQLLTEHAEPIVAGVIRKSLYVSLGASDQSHHNQDALEVAGDVCGVLVERLHQLKADPANKAIGDFHGYVSVSAHNACHQYLRRKHPERNRLGNRLRYLLTRHAGFALWEVTPEGAGGGAPGGRKETLCGFEAWRQRRKAGDYAGRLEQLCEDPEGCLRRAGMRTAADVRDGPLPDLLAAVFRWVGGPLEVNDLINAVAAIRGIKDHAVLSLSLEGEGEAEEGLGARLADERGADGARRVEQLFFLRRLWEEIRQLPPRQTAALLLNLRGEAEQGCLELFPLANVATIRQLAEAVEIPLEEFARLWNELPLDDQTIATRLGVTRQQVINLRKSARERLKRRMRSFE